MDSQRTRIDIESGRLLGRRDVSSACLISFICKGFELLFNPKKRALAALFVILEAISFCLDRFEKSQRSIRIVAFLLSVLGFLMTVLTGIRERNSMANRVQAEKQLRALEIGFSVVQLIATFMALLGTKIMNNYMSSILLVFFAVIAYGFTFVKDKEGSDTSGVENSTSSIELLHIASTPNEIGEHSDLTNTSNEMDDTEISQPLLAMLMNIGNIVFLMRLTSTWILQTLIESLMSISLIRISILQVFLVMRLMSILVLRALVMRVMSILVLQALVTRVMNILVSQALAMRLMSIMVLRALVMSILVLRALVMREMSILALRALVMREMSILVLRALVMREMSILALRALVMRVMSILALRALVMREMSILALRALVMRVMSILALQAPIMRVMSILALQARVMRVMSILALRALLMREMSILALRALVMRVMSICILVLRALVMVLRALVMRVVSICILVWQARVMRVVSILVFQACVMRLMSMLVLRALGKGLMSMLVLRALEMGLMLYKIEQFIV